MNIATVKGCGFSVAQQSGAVSKRFVISLVTISGLIAGVWALAPSTFTSDAKLIGQGKPAIALIYEGGDSDSVNLKYGYKKISEEYKHTVEFILINIRSQNGIHFLQHTKAESGTALYYDSEGKQLMVLHGPTDVASLGESIKTTFGI